MTYAQRNAIVNPAAGLIVYCTDCANGGEMQYFNGTGWINMSIGAASAPFTTPIISTNTITNISSSGALSGGNITSNGGSNITARGICWSTSANPTIDLTTKTNDGIGTGIFTSTMTGLTNNTTYYIRAYATNSVGTAYGIQQSITTSSVPLAIGSTYAGGIIFYLDNTGQHGLVCTPNDLGIYSWGCYEISIPGTSILFGSGANNTSAIVLSCSENNIAAKICDNLDLNGYSDWYLPSKNELLQIYLQLNVRGIGNFSNLDYWTSSEVNNLCVWSVKFADGSTQCSGKSAPSVGANIQLRAIRVF
jgi:hypothetical protein